MPTEPLKIDVQMTRMQQVFTHHDSDGTIRHFPVDTMRAFAEKNRVAEIKRHTVELVPKYYRFLKKNMGFEKARYNRLCEPHLSEPMVAIEWDNGNMTIIDGIHRYIKLYDTGRRMALCYTFKRSLWEQFLLHLKPGLEGMIPQLLVGDSQILPFEATKRDIRDAVKQVVREGTRS